MFDFICVCARLIFNGGVIKVRNLSRIFLFSKLYLAFLQINSILFINGQSGRISPAIRPDSWIPEKHAGSRITGYEPDIRCDPSCKHY